MKINRFVNGVKVDEKQLEKITIRNTVIVNMIAELRYKQLEKLNKK